MELKELIEISRQKIIEAHNAFYAGHPEVAKRYLVEAHNFLHKDFRLLSEHDITKLADIETSLSAGPGKQPKIELAKAKAFANEVVTGYKSMSAQQRIVLWGEFSNLIMRELIVGRPAEI